jgi:hypothetical protein
MLEASPPASRTAARSYYEAAKRIIYNQLIGWRRVVSEQFMAKDGIQGVGETAA